MLNINTQVKNILRDLSNSGIKIVRSRKISRKAVLRCLLNCKNKTGLISDGLVGDNKVLLDTLIAYKVYVTKDSISSVTVRKLLIYVTLYTYILMLLMNMFFYKSNSNIYIISSLNI